MYAEVSCFEGHTRGISSVKFSPDGTLLASACECKTEAPPHFDLRPSSLVSSGAGTFSSCQYHMFPSPPPPPLCPLTWTAADKTVRLWNPNVTSSSASSSLAEGYHPKNALVGHTSGISDVAWAADSRTLATASDDKTVRLWDLNKAGGGPPSSLPRLEPVIIFGAGAVQCSIQMPSLNKGWFGLGYIPAPRPEGQWELATSLPRSSRCVRQTQGERRRRWRCPTPSSPRSTATATTALSPPQQSVIKILYGHDSFVFCINFHPEMKILASGSFDETVKLFDVRRD